MYGDEYSPEELEELVQKALGEIEENDNRSLFSFGDTRLLEHLETILPDYVSRGEVSVILDSLREKLQEGLAGQEDTSKTLRSIHGAVSRCRVCPNVTPEPHLPRWNVVDPDVAFVLNTPLSGSDGDKFFVKTLQDVGFRSGRLCATSVVRCLPKENRPPEPSEISNCSTRFLFNELRAMRPQLIVAVGAIPAKIFLGEDIKITEERGKVFWAGPWPILIANSPGYVLRSERHTSDFISDIQKAHNFLYGK